MCFFSPFFNLSVHCVYSFFKAVQVNWIQGAKYLWTKTNHFYDVLFEKAITHVIMYIDFYHSNKLKEIIINCHEQRNNETLYKYLNTWSLSLLKIVFKLDCRDFFMKTHEYMSKKMCWSTHNNGVNIYNYLSMHFPIFSVGSLNTNEKIQYLNIMVSTRYLGNT